MTNSIPSKGSNPDGLHARYRVEHADGSPTDPAAVYFVLRLDAGGKDPGHISACRAAARRYATQVIADGGHLSQTGEEMLALLASLEPLG